MRRVPTAFPDGQFYASIARSLQLHGVGVPSEIRHSPVAVDHIPFYGPVYFALTARAFDWFGVSLRSQRSVSLAGALLVIVAAAFLASTVSGQQWRWLWAITLVLLTPEIRQWATVGTMATLGVGFELAALAIFVHGFGTGRPGRFGLGAGLFLLLAALTTPRTYPFIGGFIAAGLVWVGTTRDGWRDRARQFLVSIATLAVGMTVWAIASHGDPIRWVRYMSFILSHEDSDVAILPTAERQWLFSPAQTVTPVIAVSAALLVAWIKSRRPGALQADRARATRFVLLTCWTAFVAGAVSMNLTFFFDVYVGLPLFVAVLAMPYEDLQVGRRTLGAALALVLVLDGTLGVIWYARVAATWEARNPRALADFFDRYVPDGSTVVGPEGAYYTAVERTGAVYRKMDPRSPADWAQWVPMIEPEALTRARDADVRQTHARYFIWPAGGTIPDEYRCVLAHPVAVFVPAPHHLDRLGWLGARTRDTGYLESNLYRLPAGCPTGYDPTHS